MITFTLRLAAFLLLVLCLMAAGGGLAALAQGAPEGRGERVDIGGRRLRVVCVDPSEPGGADRPLVVLEAGAFGFSADWAAVQAVLAARGYRSCAYDRAGLGASDPGPMPRTSQAIAGDLEALLAARGETGPLIVVGHSMAGLHTRVFIKRNASRVVGLVLADAMSPEGAADPRARRFLKTFGSLAGLATPVSRLGLLKLVSPWAGDPIGLEGDADREKRFYFGKASHNQGAAAEVAAAALSVAQGVEAGRLDPDLPVAVITEGPAETSEWARARAEQALRSRAGKVTNAAGANHASMLGPRYAAMIADGVDHVFAMSARAGGK